MFEREHHRRVAHVLEALDAATLEKNACLFGGGTAIALKYGEYRESVDVDFLVSAVDGYRALRQALSGPRGVHAIIRSSTIRQARDVRADQYGIRTVLEIDGVPIKFEIVLEARIQLEAPGATDRICGIATLTTLDMAASKLLALSDRWADDSVFSRDLIDLAMMTLDKPTLKRAIENARGAYGGSVERDLAQAIRALRNRPGRLDACMQALKMTLAPALVWKNVRRLEPTKKRPAKSKR